MAAYEKGRARWQLNKLSSPFPPQIPSRIAIQYIKLAEQRETRKLTMVVEIYNPSYLGG